MTIVLLARIYHFCLSEDLMASVDAERMKNTYRPKIGQIVPTQAAPFDAPCSATVDAVSRKALASWLYQPPPCKRIMALLPQHFSLIEMAEA